VASDAGPTRGGGDPEPTRKRTVAAKALARNTTENDAARGFRKSMRLVSLTRTEGDRIAAG
jgi:hypothetical protein